jgi:hypothetical protein
VTLLKMESLTADPFRRARLRIYGGSFLLDAVGHAYPLIVSLHASYVLGLSPFLVGFLGTMMTGVYALGCLIPAVASDRLGSLPLLSTGLILLGLVALPAAAMLPGFSGLCLSSAAVGLGLALIWAPIQRELSLWSPGRLLWPALGIFNMSWAAGGVLGTLGLPEVHEHAGLAPAMGALWLVTAGAAMCLLQRPAASRALEPASVLEAVEPRVARLFVKLGWISNFAAAFSVGGLHYVFADVARRSEWAPGWAAAILAAKEAGRFLAFILLRYTSGWHYSIATLLTVQVLGGAALAACGFTSSPALHLALFAIAGAYSGLAYYSSIFYGLNLREGEGRKSSLHEGILSLGLSTGPLACGVVGWALPEDPGAIVSFTGGVVLVLGAVQGGLWVKAQRAAG